MFFLSAPMFFENGLTVFKDRCIEVEVTRIFTISLFSFYDCDFLGTTIKGSLFRRIGIHYGIPFLWLHVIISALPIVRWLKEKNGEIILPVCANIFTGLKYSCD